jgi:transmembrane sensor
MQVTQKLVILYFKGKSTLAEDSLVENWLAADPDNTNLAMQWLKEAEGEEENENVFIEMLLSKNEIWDHTAKHIESAASGTNKKNAATKPLRTFRAQWLYAAAAVSGIILLTFAFYWHKNLRIIEVATDYGQMRNVILPDRSEVVLNGNSRISYRCSWDGKPREIWLEGEAFFSVKHLKNDADFKVHLSEGKIIEVLGTEFNVTDRKRRSCVVLKSGSIKLHLSEETDDMLLKPGDLVEIKRKGSKSNPVHKVVVNPEIYSAWTKGRWKLDGTSLKEILLELEEKYGIETLVEDDKLLEKRVSGSLPLGENNIDTLVEDIAHLFRLQVVRRNNKIILAN